MEWARCPAEDPIRRSQTVQSGGNELRFKSETLGAELTNVMFILVLSNQSLSLKNCLALLSQAPGARCWRLTRSGSVFKVALQPRQLCSCCCYSSSIIFWAFCLQAHTGTPPTPTSPPQSHSTLLDTVPHVERNSSLCQHFSTGGSQPIDPWIWVATPW